jgi:S1-C subfamily serine protease
MAHLRNFSRWMRGGWFMAPALVLMAVLLFAGCAVSTVTAPARTQQYAPTVTAVSQVTPLFDENSVMSLYDKSITAVVQIETVVESPLSKLPGTFGLNAPKQMGQGSGFLIDGQGHIVTNNHVVDGATSVKILLSDGTQLDGKVVGTDRSDDIAVVQADASKINNTAYLTLGDSSKVRPGQMAVALGSPYGLQGSITVGVISGIGRSLPSSNDRTMTNIIQTDAAINPGNSGGPLLNSSGEVIGINTAIEASANGVGFAVPINMVKSRLPDLLKGGSIKAAWLGIEGMPVSKDLTDQLKLTTDKGVYVVSVLPGSPAEKSGLVAGGKDQQNDPKAGGDIITAIDNAPVASVQDILSYLNGKRPGEKVTLSVQRSGQNTSVPVELGEWPDKMPSGFGANPLPNDNGNGFDIGPFHFRIR